MQQELIRFNETLLEDQATANAYTALYVDVRGAEFDAKGPALLLENTHATAAIKYKITLMYGNTGVLTEEQVSETEVLATVQEGPTIISSTCAWLKLEYKSSVADTPGTITVVLSGRTQHRNPIVTQATAPS